jgi:glycosyltransferase involved in cell wall biosynthesis
MAQISGLIITLNEEANIGACLASMQPVCSEIVVIDSHSTDGTVAIAEAAGAKVYRQPYLGDRPQRSYGLKYCSCDWVLNLDADERLEADAVRCIRDIDLSQSTCAAYALRRKNILHGKWIRVAGWYPDYVRRLFNRRLADFSPVYMHTKITTQRVEKLDGHIVHYSFEGYADMIRTLNSYSDWLSRGIVEKGKPVYALKPFIHGFLSFVKHYVVKRGFTAGMDGFVISSLNAFGSFFKYAKAIEHYRRSGND